MKISVIIPMYNAEKSIVRALDSVKNQTFDGFFEIIIVNDGSKDDSVEIVREYQKANNSFKNFTIVLISQENGGVSKARNTGLANATGDFLAFLDSDDAWLVDKIQSQFTHFLTNDGVDFIGGGFQGFLLPHRNEKELVKISFDDLLFKNYFQPSTVIMKREIFEKIGYFDESQKYAEEGNYFFRVARSFNCFFLNSILILYGDGKAGFGVSGLSANLKEMEKGELKNLRYAYDQKWIGFLKYLLVTSFSLLKYTRRVIIVKLK
ncbi:glycosyltransferase family 2 protein [Sphingobacterium hungaricum]